MYEAQGLDEAAAAARERAGEPMDVTEGGSHTKVVIGSARTVVPRHSEISEHTARAILRQMGAGQ